MSGIDDYLRDPKRIAQQLEQQVESELWLKFMGPKVPYVPLSARRRLRNRIVWRIKDARERVALWLAPWLEVD